MLQDSQRRAACGPRPCAGPSLPVLCAPVVEPRTGNVLGVLYLQNGQAFGELDRAWIEVYARALGRALAWRREGGQRHWKPRPRVAWERWPWWWRASRRRMGIIELARGRAFALRSAVRERR